jgi:hypothetical protein
LGDKHDLSTSEFANWTEIETYLTEEEDAAVILPLRLLDHSGLSMSTSTRWPYDCPWDAMWVGFIYATKEDIRQEYGLKRVSAKARKRAMKVLLGEVEVYDQHLRGER